MRRLAMNRHQNLRLHPFIHLPKLASAWVTRHVHERIRILHDFDALLDELVLDRDDALLIAGNDARGKDHRVARRKLNAAHLLARKLGERCPRFSLAAGTEDYRVLARDVVEFIFREKLWQPIQVAELR